MTLKYNDFQGNLTVQREASKQLWRPEGNSSLMCTFLIYSKLIYNLFGLCICYKLIQLVMVTGLFAGQHNTKLHGTITGVTQKVKCTFQLFKASLSLPPVLDFPGKLIFLPVLYRAFLEWRKSFTLLLTMSIYYLEQIMMLVAHFES